MANVVAKVAKVGSVIIGCKQPNGGPGAMGGNQTKGKHEEAGQLEV